MTTDAKFLESNLNTIEKGVVGFRVLSIIFTVFAALSVGLVVLAFGRHVGADGATFADAAGAVLMSGMKVVEWALLAWFARLASAAFASLGALTRENAGLV